MSSYDMEQLINFKKQKQSYKLSHCLKRCQTRFYARLEIVQTFHFEIVQ